MNPKNVVSPKSLMKLGEVLYENEDFAIASLLWGKKLRIGIRWNGKENELGYPNSRGRATWFVLPKAVALAYAETIGDAKMKHTIELSTEDSFV